MEITLSSHNVFVQLQTVPEKYWWRNIDKIWHDPFVVGKIRNSGFDKQFW